MKQARFKTPVTLVVLLLVLSLLIGITACSGNKATTAPTTSQSNTQTTAPVSQAAAQHKVLKLGSVTGFSTKEGLEIKRWHDLIAKTVNAEGGWKVGNDVYDLQIITYDGGAFDDTKSRAAIEKLIYEDKVQIIVDTFLINDKQSAQITKDNNVLLLGEGFTSDTAVPEFTNSYRTTGIYFGRAMNYLIAKDYYDKGSRKVAFINGNSEQSQVQIEQYGSAYKLAGIQVLEPVFYNSDTVDFGPIATKVKSLGADSVCFPDAGSSLAINIMGALYDAGWKGTIFPSSLQATDLEKIYAKVGSWCDGMLGLYNDPRGIPIVQNNPETKKWLDAYVKEYGNFVDSGCFWVSGIWFLRDAIMSTQSVDAATIQKYLDNSKKGVATLTGYAQLFARPDLKNFRTMEVAPGHGLAIAKGGKFEFYKQNSVKDQYLVSIKAYGLVDVYKKYWDEYGKPTFPADTQYSVFDFADLDK